MKKRAKTKRTPRTRTRRAKPDPKESNVITILYKGQRYTFEGGVTDINMDSSPIETTPRDALWRTFVQSGEIYLTIRALGPVSTEPIK